MQTVVSGPTWSPTLTNGGESGLGGGVERADHRAADQERIGIFGSGRCRRCRRGCGLAGRSGWRRQRRHRAGHGHHLRAAPQANPLVGLAQVDLGQVVLVHQLDEAADLANVEDVARAGARSRIGGHRCLLWFAQYSDSVCRRRAVRR